jgi:hypothetical protein
LISFDLVPRLLTLSVFVPSSCSSSSPLCYFVGLALSAFGVAEGDAAAGLTTGLGFVAGAVSAGVAGEDELAGDTGDGLAAVGVELSADSVAQPTANRIVESDSANSAARVILEVVIVVVPRFSRIEKRDDNCPSADS